MIHYLDTSALVKAYVEEHRSAEVRELIREAASDDGATRIYVSRLAFPEATSAFTRLRNEGKLSSADAELRFRMLETDFTSEAPSYELIDPSAAVITASAQLVRKHGLRAFDAVHLATALLLNDVTDRSCVLVAADRQLLRGAAAEGMPVRDLS